MRVYCIGNSLLTTDSLPLKIMPELKKTFPDIVFEDADPNDNFYPEEGSVIIDSVAGISGVRVFHSLDAFCASPRVSAHDYDLFLRLRLLIKLGKIRTITIIGIPQSTGPNKALHSVAGALRTLRKQA